MRHQAHVASKFWKGVEDLLKRRSQYYGGWKGKWAMIHNQITMKAANAPYAMEWGSDGARRSSSSFREEVTF